MGFLIKWASSFFLLCALFICLQIISLKALSKDSKYPQWQFQSRYDLFRIQQRPNGFWIGNSRLKNEKASQMQYYVQWFDQYYPLKCPANLSPPDLEISHTSAHSDRIEKIHVFLKELVFRKGRNCLYLDESMVYEMPFHRLWLTGASSLRIPSPHKRIKIEINNQTYQFQERALWTEANQKIYPSHQNLSQLKSFLDQFKIKKRWHLKASKKPWFKVTHKKTYIFHKLFNGNVGIQFPNTEWLLEAAGFPYFKDTFLEFLEDSHSKDLKVIQDLKKPLSVRLSLLRNLSRRQSPHLKPVCQKMIQNKDEFNLMRIEASHILISDPTRANLNALIKSLNHKDNLKLLQTIIKHLRSIHPKGPSILSNDNSRAIRKKIAAWSLWWQSQQYRY